MSSALGQHIERVGGCAKSRSGCAVVPEFLGFPTVAIGCSPDILNVDIALLIQRSEDSLKTCEGLGDVLRPLVLGVGFVRDFDVEVNTVLTQIAQQAPSNRPRVLRHVINGDCGDLTLLFEDTRRDVQQQFIHLAG